MQLSTEALALLRYRMESKDKKATPDNIEAYRELECAGIMYSVSGFVSGPEYLFRWTDSGWAMRHELTACAKAEA